jgi:hypothetical protein
MSARDDAFGSRFPDADITAHPSHSPKRERLAMAENRLQHEKLLGTGRGDGDVYVEVGFRDENEYWNDRTAGVMSMSDFIDTLAIHRLNPGLEGCDGFARDLSHALNFAIENGEAWIIRAKDELRLRPRDAAAYLLSQPQCEHLVPESLKIFLESQKSPTAAPAASSMLGSKQRSQPKRNKIKERMREWLREGHSPAELRDEKEKGLANLFGGRDGESRDVYRKARDELLAEVGQSRSTKTTND